MSFFTVPWYSLAWIGVPNKSGRPNMRVIWTFCKGCFDWTVLIERPCPRVWPPTRRRTIKPPSVTPLSSRQIRPPSMVHFYSWSHAPLTRYRLHSAVRDSDGAVHSKDNMYGSINCADSSWILGSQQRQHVWIDQLCSLLVDSWINYTSLPLIYFRPTIESMDDGLTCLELGFIGL